MGHCSICRLMHHWGNIGWPHIAVAVAIFSSSTYSTVHMLYTYNLHMYTGQHNYILTKTALENKDIHYLLTGTCIIMCKCCTV